MTELVNVAGLHEVPAGSMLALNISGERILLINVQEEIFAIQGQCTHQLADLSEGSLDGHLLYCPRHFSEFDVRSGEVLSPPATQDLRTYEVIVNGNRIYVKIDVMDNDADPSSLRLS